MTLRAVLATVGRFHAFDLATQLQRHGHLAAIYSGFPRRNFRDMAVDPARIRSFPWLQTPVALAQRYGMMPERLFRALTWYAHVTLDRYVARTLPDCNVLWAMSGTGLAAGRVARGRGIAHVCDRGSTHIAMQDRLLRDAYAAQDLPFAGIDPRFIAMQSAEYAEADAITVPSAFVRDSFVAMGIPDEKLHTIPYGVDLSAFRPCAPRDKAFRVLFVGSLSVRKGLPFLLQGFARARLPAARLVLVGPPAPETGVILARNPEAAAERAGPLPRPLVAAAMSRASVLVLPSEEEGLALVQAQAMACGCPVIATPNTGAADLFTDGREGFIVPARDADAIADRLTRLHDDPALRARMSRAALDRVRALGGWDAYGRAAIALFAMLARARGHDVTIAPGLS